MSNVNRLTIEDLKGMCDEAEEESLRLEFKPCSELQVGTWYRDRKGIRRERDKNAIVDELSKDVSAFLNSAGGILVYGILEKHNSRANRLDDTNAFRPDGRALDVRPEKVVQWLRAHVQPAPSVDVYRVFQKPGDAQSPWYLVIDVLQGQQAYMARDHKFYKRIGATRQPMEQYEVVDAMNRTRGAQLDLQLNMETVNPLGPAFSRPDWPVIYLYAEVTSTNYIASEYGALHLTLVCPMQFSSPYWAPSIGRDFQLKEPAGLDLGTEEVADAQTIIVKWGANEGNIVFPGAWYDFDGKRFSIQVPPLTRIADPTYLLQFEVFTINAHSTKCLFAIRRRPQTEEFEWLLVDSANYADVIEAFWATYHKAQQVFRK